MRKPITILLSLSATVGLVFAATVGSGPYSLQVTQSFVNAFNRNGFSALVNATPFGGVGVLAGSTGLIQEFISRANPSYKLALIKPDPAEPVSESDTLQLSHDLYSAYLAVGVAKAGLPQTDSLPCSGIPSCTYQLFSKNYGLFVYSNPGIETFVVSDPIFSVWKSIDSTTGALGPATGSPSAVVSSLQTSGTGQLFAHGAIFAYGTVAYSVTGATYEAFAAYGAQVLGFPIAEEITFANGLHRQTFQGGKIEYTSGKSASVIFPLSQLYITNATTGLGLNSGDTARISAVSVDSLSNVVTGRVLNWTSSNSSVAVVTSNGDSATVKALGSGQARIIVTGEGITSSPITVSVSGVCCLAGEGAPTAAISQAFQSALTRNRLTVNLPNPTPVASLENGYVQTLTAAGSTTAVVVSLAVSSPNAYVSRGVVYTAYQSNGGFTGTLGFPASDISAGGTQLYTSGAALSGLPVRVVPAAIAAKWAALGGDSGSLGVPFAAAAVFTSVSARTGSAQGFTNGFVFSSPLGSFVSTGLILSRYLELGGAGGTLGLPTADPVLKAGIGSQSFEFGFIDLQAGAASAVEHFYPRVPGVKVTPSAVAPGGRVRVSISGFAPGGTLTVAVTGQAGFAVTAATGGFSWDIVVPAGTKAGAVSVQAQSGTDTAAASYSVTSMAQLQPTVSLVSGDHQTGVPGGALGLPLISVVLDASGNPLPGVPVTYSVSPGASAVLPPVTDSAGRVSAVLRLPLTSGVAVLSVAVAGQVVSFSALVAAKSILNFPANSGGLTGALASLLRFQQNAGTLGAPNGLASDAVLGKWLAANNGLATSDSGSTIVNPWIAARFAGGSVVLDTPSTETVRDLVNAGVPSVAILRLANGSSVAVNPIAVRADGSVSGVSDYPDGTITGVIRVTGSAPGGFVFSSPLSAEGTAASPAGDCLKLDIPDGASTGVRFLGCTNEQPAWQLVAAPGKGGTLVDITNGLNQPVTGAVQVSRIASALMMSVIKPTITAAVNAANPAVGVSPGSFVSIFGFGFGTAPQVTIGGVVTTTVASFPFQINALVPPGIPVGATTLQVSSSLGSASSAVTVAGSAPGIFVLNTDQGAIVNQDGSVNGAASPAQRSQFITIFGTGLGATTLRAGLQAVATPVTVVLNGVSLTPSFAGISPGTPGLYQVNVQIPASTVPGVGVLTWNQAGQNSNAVPIAIQ